MTSKLIDESPALVRAIRDAFTGSAVCHCHSEGKLSETELLASLVHYRHVEFADVNSIECLPIYQLMGRTSFPCFQLERAGVKFLPQLTAWTVPQLLKIDRIGAVQVEMIEVMMARYGLALQGTDPRRLAQLQQEEKAEVETPPIEGTPEEIRAICAKELVAVAQRLQGYSASLMRQAVRAGAGDRVSGTLSKTIKASYRVHRAALGLVKPLRDLEQRGAKPRAEKSKPVRENVVVGVFAQREPAAAG